MQKKAFSIALLFISFFSVYAQPSWKLLPDSPTASRFDDLCFINAQTGWIAGNGQGSRIYRTTNGGFNWQLLYTFQGYVRSILYLDSLTGFAGKLEGPPQRFFKTTNGGLNWDSVSFSSDPPRGICGLSAFGNTIYGSGVYYGSPKIIKSTNRGLTWTVIDMSTYAGALIDCHFISEAEGFVVGGIGSTYSTRKSVILYTSNGGSSWVSRFISSRIGNWGWKIDFPSANIGYVSLENISYTDSCYFAKTTNGGLNWFEKPYGLGNAYREQGIGFVNENSGWIGGSSSIFGTTNGGDSWTLLNFGPDFGSANRFRFYGDSLGYAAGGRIFKYTLEPIGIAGNQNTVPIYSSLHQNYPNPFNPVTVIKYEIFESSMSTIRIYNSTGEEVYVFMNGYRPPGIREFIWYGNDNSGNSLPSGVYFYKLETEKYSETKKMMLVR